MFKIWVERTKYITLKKINSGGWHVNQLKGQWEMLPKYHDYECGFLLMAIWWVQFISQLERPCLMMMIMVISVSVVWCPSGGSQSYDIRETMHHDDDHGYQCDCILISIKCASLIRELDRPYASLWWSWLSVRMYSDVHLTRRNFCRWHCDMIPILDDVHVYNYVYMN